MNSNTSILIGIISFTALVVGILTWLLRNQSTDEKDFEPEEEERDCKHDND